MILCRQINQWSLSLRPVSSKPWPCFEDTHIHHVDVSSSLLFYHLSLEHDRFFTTLEALSLYDRTESSRKMKLLYSETLACLGLLYMELPSELLSFEIAI